MSSTRKVRHQSILILVREKLIVFKNNRMPMLWALWRTNSAPKFLMWPSSSSGCAALSGRALWLSKVR
jgi:hypothetical protein